MKQTHIFRIVTPMIALVVLFGVGGARVSAIDDEYRGEETELQAQSARIAQMEQLLNLLEQVVMLLTKLKSTQSMYGAPAVLTPVGEMETHHELHASEPENNTHTTNATATPTITPIIVPQLVIEVEGHNGKTHTHVRHVDKTEEMFFVNSAITDQAGIVADIVAKTGLTADAVKAALKYLE